MEQPQPREAPVLSERDSASNIGDSSGSGSGKGGGPDACVGGLGASGGGNEGIGASNGKHDASVDHAKIGGQPPPPDAGTGVGGEPAKKDAASRWGYACFGGFSGPSGGCGIRAQSDPLQDIKDGCRGIVLVAPPSVVLRSSSLDRSPLCVPASRLPIPIHIHIPPRLHTAWMLNPLRYSRYVARLIHGVARVPHPHLFVVAIGSTACVHFMYLPAFVGVRRPCLCFQMSCRRSLSSHPEGSSKVPLTRST